MRKKVTIGVLGAAAVIALTGVTSLAAGETGSYVLEETPIGIIEDNVYIADIDVGGLSEAEAVSRVQEYVDGLKDTTFTLDYAGNEVTMSAGEMGLYWSDEGKVSGVADIGKTGNLIDRYKVKKDLEHENIKIDITLDVDEAKIADYLKEKLSIYDVEPQNYGLKRENGQFIITDGNTGVALDVAASAEGIVDYITNDWDRASSKTFEMASVVTEPESDKASLELVTDLMGTFTTDFSSSSAGRATNVRVGASKIDGTVLYPGDELSVYDLVNPMTAENGYELAGSYENGTTVQTYGGGMCQVSSTLYNAALRAEMTIEERYCHSMIVTYVQPSMDAAIAGTYKNLRFSNPYDYPVYIEGYTNGGLITFNIYGHETRPANRTVTYESETISELQPELQIQADSTHGIGYVSTVQSAHVGKGACLWKIVTIDGEEVSREVWNRSTYNASPKIIAVGVASDNPDAVAQINAAIATRDEATIRNTAAALSAAAVEPETEEPSEEDGEAAGGETEQKKDKDKKKDNDTKTDEKKTQEETSEPAESQADTAADAGETTSDASDDAADEAASEAVE